MPHLTAPDQRLLPPTLMGGHDDNTSPPARSGRHECFSRHGNAVRQSQDYMAVPTGLEPVTFGLGNRCSIRLSYGTTQQNQRFRTSRWLHFIQFPTLFPPNLRV